MLWHCLKGLMGRGVVALAAIVLPAGIGITHAQVAERPAAPMAIESLPAGLRQAAELGLHVRATTYARPAWSTVVVVPDVRSFAAALSLWRAEGIFPVLLDDGTYTAQEHIMRFVRGTGAGEVVRWTAPATFAWPAKGEQQGLLLRRIAEMAGASSEHIPVDLLVKGASDEAINDAMTKVLRPAKETSAALYQARAQLRRTGVVLTSMEDTAWPGALALAAGHTQPLRFVAKPRGNDSSGQLSLAEARAMQADMIKASPPGMWDVAAGVGGAPAQQLAITLAINMPVRVILTEGELAQLRMPPSMNVKAGEAMAMSDVLSRRLEAGKGQWERFTVVGQVMGTSSGSAYAAMCAIFLPGRTDSAWLFDSYEAKAPFTAYSCESAASTLRQNKWQTKVNGPRDRSLEQWRMQLDLAIKAGLVLMNSSGMPQSFDLQGGLGVPGDVPILGVPAAVHMIHSWSANNPLNRWTVGGRWLDRGAYAYIGSVHEPYLAAFVPTPMLANRLLLSMPLALAARVDDLPMWRINALGDPLISFGPGKVERGRPAGELPLSGEATTAVLAAALKERKLDVALRALVTLGRDADAVKLAAAVMREETEKKTERKPGANPESEMTAWIIKQDLAAALMGSAYRTGDVETLLRLSLRVPITRDDDTQDMVWQMAYAKRNRLTPVQLQEWTERPRRDLYVRDVTDGAAAVASRQSQAAAAAYIRRMIEQTTDGGTRGRLEELSKTYSKGP